MKGDRFEKMVEDTFGPTQTLLRGEVIALLRKEHAAVRRMVERERLISAKRRYTKAETAYYTACTNILNWLDRRAKGGTK